jgi:hypothetical protein
MAKEITAHKYSRMVFMILFIGFSINAILMTYGLHFGFNYYISAYMSLAGMIMGFALGMAWAHYFKIKKEDSDGKRKRRY